MVSMVKTNPTPYVTAQKSLTRRFLTFFPICIGKISSAPGSHDFDKSQ